MPGQVGIPTETTKSEPRSGVESGPGQPSRTSSGGRTRTCDPTVNSRLLYQLSYAGKTPVNREKKKLPRPSWSVNGLPACSRGDALASTRHPDFAAPLASSCPLPPVPRSARIPPRHSPLQELEDGRADLM